MEKQEKNVKDLTFIRTFDFRYIPRALFEQVEETDTAMIDRIYGFGSLFGGSPFTLLYVLIDQINKIKGVLWAEIDPIDAIIFVRLLSLDKEYQSPSGQILNKAKDFLLNLPTGPELKKEIHFFTTRPDAYKKVGAKRSKRIIMECKNVEPMDRPSEESKPDAGNGEENKPANPE